jgi:ferredoxin
MATHTLVVDSIACVGHGICADLFPEWVRLDSWGYPIINKEAIPPEMLVHARWAVANCPALALHLRAQADSSPKARGGLLRRRKPAASGAAKPSG